MGATERDEDDDRRRRRLRRLLAGVVGLLLVGTGAVAVGNWVVGVDPGSSGAARSAGIANLTITATATPAPNALLYPGADGDVVLTIRNPNDFPVTITAVTLPAATGYADGFVDAALTTPQSGCSAATPSGVAWKYAAAGPSSHDLTTPVTVAPSGAADDPLTVVLSGAATMSASAPAACASSYFRMPSLVGITATGGAATPSSGPVTTSWTS